MRFIPYFLIEPGMLLGEPLLSADGRLLLGAGQMIKQTHLSAIKSMNYPGVFIQDNFKTLESDEKIQSELCQSIVSAIEKFSYITNSDETEIKKNETGLRKFVESSVSRRDILVNAGYLKSFDERTFRHSVDVAAMSYTVGVSLNLPAVSLADLLVGAILHDIGKLYIPKDLLNKNGRLTDSEYEKVKTHPVMGYEYLNTYFKINSGALLGVLQHHERFNGTGYPQKLSGKQISYVGKIIAVADNYDAMTSDRPHREALQNNEVMEYIMGGAGSLFDPKFAVAFTRSIAAYPLGTLVRLSNGLSGVVVRNYGDCNTRPKIKIIDIETSRQFGYIDLKNDSDTINITITKVLKR